MGQKQRKVLVQQATTISVSTWASNVRPEWQRFSALHKMKPGRISSSSMPLRRSFRFSPGPASSVSTSSDSRLSTSTVCWKNAPHITFQPHRPSELKTAFQSSSASSSLTLFGIMISCCALLILPDSSLPRTTVPMSCTEKGGGG